MYVALRVNIDEDFYCGQICATDMVPLIANGHERYLLTVNGKDKLFRKGDFYEVGETKLELELYLHDRREYVAKAIDESDLLAVRVKDGKPISYMLIVRGNFIDITSFYDDIPNYYVEKLMDFIMEYAQSTNKEIMYITIEPEHHDVKRFTIRWRKQKHVLVTKVQGFKDVIKGMVCY